MFIPSYVVVSTNLMIFGSNWIMSPTNRGGSFITWLQIASFPKADETYRIQKHRKIPWPTKTLKYPNGKIDLGSFHSGILQQICQFFRLKGSNLPLVDWKEESRKCVELSLCHAQACLDWNLYFCADCFTLVFQLSFKSIVQTLIYAYHMWYMCIDKKIKIKINMRRSYIQISAKKYLSSSGFLHFPSSPFLKARVSPHQSLQLSIQRTTQTHKAESLDIQSYLLRWTVFRVWF